MVTTEALFLFAGDERVAGVWAVLWRGAIGFEGTITGIADTPFDFSTTRHVTVCAPP